jgi:hypothetical protein
MPLMPPRPTAIERAYQLARSGEFSSITAIRKRLDTEGFHDARGQVSGQTLLKALRVLWVEAGRRREMGRP